jgi:hypothetical protein
MAVSTGEMFLQGSLGGASIFEDQVLFCHCIVIIEFI